MQTSIRTPRHIGSVSAIVIGWLLLSWGLLSIAAPTWQINTIPPLDATLAILSQYLWVPALGFLLVLIGLLSDIYVRVRTSIFWLAGSLLLGALLVCLGGFLTLVSLNNLAGAVYVSPVLLSGVGLLAIAAYARDSDRPVEREQER